jgi:hypothetical protein
MGRQGLDQAGAGWGQMKGPCECDDELSGSTKNGEFLD